MSEEVTNIDYALEKGFTPEVVNFPDGTKFINDLSGWTTEQIDLMTKLSPMQLKLHHAYQEYFALINKMKQLLDERGFQTTIGSAPADEYAQFLKSLQPETQRIITTGGGNGLMFMAASADNFNQIIDTKFRKEMDEKQLAESLKSAESECDTIRKILHVIQNY